MKIRRKLTVQFVFIVASILLLSLVSIYLYSSHYRKVHFIDRLIHRANSTVKLFIDIEGIDSTLLNRINQTHPAALYKINIAIYNKFSHLIYSNKDIQDIKINNELLEKVKTDKEIYIQQNDFEIAGIEYNNNRDKYIVFAGAIDKDGLKELQSLKIILIIVFILGVIIVFFTGRIYAGKALYPISKMIQDVEKISISKISSRIEEGRQKDELTDLAKTFNSMLDRLEKSFTNQKRFIANASHELRTPLTAISGQLEVSVMSSKDVDYYKSKINLVLEEIKNLSHTSNQLLALAQVESDSTEINFKSFRFDEMIWQSYTDLLKRNPTYVIKIGFINLPEDESELMFYGNETLLKTAVINLMDNGCKFSSNKSVSLIIVLNKNNIKLLFIDEGVGISPSDMPYIFQPFYRSKTCNKTKGSGIGLSLAKSIITLHQGVIEVNSILNQGTTFTVTLPVSIL